MTALIRFGNALGAAGLALVLLIALVLQVLLKELPCPICNLQRVAFVLCGFGFLLNLRYGAQPAHYGITLLGALFSLVASGRQVLLHIVPDTGSYGSAIFGMHYYTWALLLFLAVIAGVTVLMLVAGSGRFDHPRSDALAEAQFAGFARFAAWFLIAMTLANAINSFVLCGPIDCSGDPEGYWLFRLF